VNVSKISCPVVDRNSTTDITTTTDTPSTAASTPGTIAATAGAATTAAVAATAGATTVAAAATTVTVEGSGSGDGDISSDLIRDDPTEDSTQVCGTDQQTYESICHLIQTTTNVQVLYAGNCNATECEQGEVSDSKEVYSYVFRKLIQEAN